MAEGFDPRTAPEWRGRQHNRHPNVVIGPDGKLFLALVPGEVTRSTPITVLLNWQAVLMT